AMNVCRSKIDFGRARLPAVPYSERNYSTARLKAVPSQLRANKLFLISLLLPMCAIQAAAQSPVVLDHNGSTIALEPYAPNIIRVTLSLQKDQALAAPGLGFIAHPAADAWSHQHTDATDTYQSSRMVIRVDASHPGGTLP